MNQQQNKKPTTAEKETRYYPTSLRMEGDEDLQKDFVGEAAVYNSPSEDLGDFVEVIEPGFFDEALSISDTRCLVNHNNEKILGRVGADTLTLELTDTGLNYRCTNPGTSYAKDLAISISRNDINKSSFAFSIKRKYNGDDMDGDEWEMRADGVWVRRLLPNGCKYIYDVSPVTFPAYPDTSTALRGLEAAKKASKVTPPKKQKRKTTLANKKRYVNIL